MRYLARVGSREFTVEITRRGGGHAVRLDGIERAVEVRGSGGLLVVSVNGRSVGAAVGREGVVAGRTPGGERRFGVVIGGRFYPVHIADPLHRPVAADSGLKTGPAEVRSAMPGKVTALMVEEGQEVRAGQRLVVVEAMKMENELQAPRDGRVTSVRVRPGEAVEAGALLVTVG